MQFTEIFNGSFQADATAAAEASRGFAPIPSGRYLVQINDSKLQATKAGDGQMVALVFEVIDGPHLGRKLWHRLNILNPNPKAQEFGRRDLNMLVVAVGHAAINSAEELNNAFIVIQVNVDKDNKNDVKGFFRATPENCVTPQVKTHQTVPAFPVTPPKAFATPAFPAMTPPKASVTPAFVAPTLPPMPAFAPSPTPGAPQFDRDSFFNRIGQQPR